MKLSRALSALAVVLFLVVLVALLVLPVLAVLLSAFRTDTPLNLSGEWSTVNVARFWETLIESGSLANSLILAVVATSLSLLVAGYFVFVVERTDAWIGRHIPTLMVVALLVFSLITAMGYVLVGDKTLGIINQLARAVSGDETLTLTSASGWPMVVFVSVLTGSNASFFLLSGAMGRLDRSLEEASLVAGAGRLRTFTRVTGPLLTPLVSGIVLITVIVYLQTFTVPFILRSEPEFLLTQIVDYITLVTPPDYGAASVVGMVLLFVALLLAWAQWRLLRGRQFETVGGKSGATARIVLQKSKPWVNASVVAYFVLALLIPVAAVVVSSFTRYPGIYTEFTLDPYRRVFADSALARATWTSVWTSVLAGFAGVLVTLGIVLLRTRSKSRLIAFIIGAAAVVALGLPGVVQAVGMIWSYALVPGLQKLYATNWLVMIGLVVVVIPLLNQVLYGALRQISPDLEDAAVVAGARRIVAFFTVTVPLLAPTFLAAWFISSVIAFGTLEIPLLLGPPGQRTFIQLIQSSFNALDRSYASALTTLFLLVIAVLSTAFTLVRGALRRRTGLGDAPTTVGTAAEVAPAAAPVRAEKTKEMEHV